MEPSNNSQSTQQTISLWITSLAVSITCCAVLFVVFAGYLTDIKKNLAEANTQLEQMSLHQDQLLIEIRSL
ncbi:MAG TPA: hypothetical protein VFR09_09535, partial [Alphaproteobacteria bacterium]|nr:hypothetical protein [Alphaproteobacteria bacterium]